YRIEALARPGKRSVEIHFCKRVAEMGYRFGIDVSADGIESLLPERVSQRSRNTAGSVQDARARRQAECWKPFEHRALNHCEYRRPHAARRFLRTSSYTWMVPSTIRPAENRASTSRRPAAPSLFRRQSSMTSRSIAAANSFPFGSTTSAVRWSSTTSTNAPRLVETQGRP